MSSSWSISSNAVITASFIRSAGLLPAPGFQYQHGGTVIDAVAAEIAAATTGHHLALGGDTPSPVIRKSAAGSGKVYRGASVHPPPSASTRATARVPVAKEARAERVARSASPAYPCACATPAAAVVGLGFIGSGDDVSGAAIGQATIGEPVDTPFHSGGYASYPERIELVCGACDARRPASDRSDVAL